LDQFCSPHVPLRGWPDTSEAPSTFFEIFYSAVVGISVLDVCIPAGYAGLYAIHASHPSAATDDVGGRTVSRGWFCPFLSKVELVNFQSPENCGPVRDSYAIYYEYVCEFTTARYSDTY